jgi:hypothetical protein
MIWMELESHALSDSAMSHIKTTCDVSASILPLLMEGLKSNLIK